MYHSIDAESFHLHRVLATAHIAVYDGQTLCGDMLPCPIPTEIVCHALIQFPNCLIGTASMNHAYHVGTATGEERVQQMTA